MYQSDFGKEVKPGRPKRLYPMGRVEVPSSSFKALVALARSGPLNYYQLSEKFRLRRDYQEMRLLLKEGLIREVSKEAHHKATRVELTRKGFVNLMKLVAVHLATEESFADFFSEATSVKKFLPKLSAKLTILESVRWGSSGRTLLFPPLISQIFWFFFNMGAEIEEESFDLDDALLRHLSAWFLDDAPLKPELLDIIIADPDFKRYVADGLHLRIEKLTLHLERLRQLENDIRKPGQRAR